jgi:hypothetical protein
MGVPFTRPTTHVGTGASPTKSLGQMSGERRSSGLWRGRATFGHPNGLKLSCQAVISCHLWRRRPSEPGCTGPRTQPLSLFTNDIRFRGPLSMTEGGASPNSPVTAQPIARPFAAILEVLLLTLLIPTASSALAHFVPPSPLRTFLLQSGFGVIATAAVACVLIAVHRRGLKASGFTFARWREGVKVAGLLSLISVGYIAASFGGFRLASAGHGTGWEAPARSIALIFVLPTLILLGVLARFYQPIVRREPAFGRGTGTCANRFVCYAGAENAEPPITRRLCDVGDHALWQRRRSLRGSS